MNHPMGKWRYAQRHIQNLVPVPEVARMLIADRNMVGLHVRNVFDGMPSPCCCYDLSRP